MHQISSSTSIKDKQVAISICCAPGCFDGEYFSPTSKDIITNMAGEISEHPICSLEKTSSNLKRAVQEKAIGKIYVLIDDIDVFRNWILPPNLQQQNIKQTLYKFISTSVCINKLKNKAREDYEIKFSLLSDFLKNNNLFTEYKKIYSILETSTYALFNKKQNFYEKSPESSDFEKMIISNALRRKKFFKRVNKENSSKKDLSEEIKKQAIQYVANYVAQGIFISGLKNTLYLVTEPSEVQLMNLKKSISIEKLINVIPFEEYDI